MSFVNRALSFTSLCAVAFVAACGSDSSTGPSNTPKSPCTAGSVNGPMQTLGCGLDTTRYTSEIAVHGTTAYTTTWGRRIAPGNKVNIWDVSHDVPVLVDSLIVPNASTTGDVAVSDDGKLLVVATEFTLGSIAIYDLADPRHPKFISQFTNDQTNPGVHTAEIGRVNGKLYAFLCVDPQGNSVPARIVIVDLSNPAAPQQVFVKQIGAPYVHDTFLRDGLLFLALWNDGLQIWDLGGGGTGGTPENPHVLGTVKTLGGEVHNVWWYHDASGAKRYAFVGQEGPGSIGSSSFGDIHVVDVSDLTNPREVAFYHVDGAGTHNFSVDETNGVLYAAYYNAGVRAIDVRGDLGTCSASQQDFSATANLTRCNLRLMGRELAVGLLDQPRTVYVWGVQYTNGRVYASDMLNGIWTLRPAK